jgi:hypothetical protein
VQPLRVQRRHGLGQTLFAHQILLHLRKIDLQQSANGLEPKREKHESALQEHAFGAGKLERTTRSKHPAGRPSEGQLKPRSSSSGVQVELEAYRGEVGKGVDVHLALLERAPPRRLLLLRLPNRGTGKAT